MINYSTSHYVPNKGIRYRIPWVVLCLLITAPLLSSGDLQPETTLIEPKAKPSIQAIRVEKGPQIDGRLEEPLWGEAPAAGPLWQYEPNQGHEMTERTEFRVVYDDQNLYIGVWCFDSEPDKINARVMQRENRGIYSDDYLYMALDTFHDQRNGYIFVVNPNGARYDQIVSNNIFLNSNWDGVWRAAASIDNEGWKAELAIPFKSLSFDPAESTWGFNISRSISRKVERGRWTGAEPHLHTFHVSQAGDILNLSGLKQGLGIEVSPYALARLGRKDSHNNITADFGTDARYRITPKLSATLSYNTDFAETEVDQRQFNFTRFPLFFPERRAFFLEDSGVFEYGGLTSSGRSRGLSRPVIPFFSRRIGRDNNGATVPILLAGKMAGRSGKYNMGFMDAMLEDHQGLGMQNVFAGRITRDIWEQSSVGMISTMGDPNSARDNYLIGPDFRYRTGHFMNDKVIEANVFALGSQTDGPTSETGYAYGSSLAYPNDLFNIKAQFIEISDAFDPALGFVRRRDVRGYYTYTSWNPRPSRPAWLRQYHVSYTTEHFTDLDNTLETGEHRFTPIWLELNSGDDIFLSYTREFDGPNQPFSILQDLTIPAGEYAWDRYMLGVDFASRRQVSGELSLSYGDFYLGDRWRTEAEITYYPWKRLGLGLDYAYNHINFPQGVADAHIGAGRALINFTTNLTWAHLVQYDSLSDSVGYNSRLIWEYRPGSKFFAVFNQNYLTENLKLTLQQTELAMKVGAIFRF
ncbi:carbohydrate binding family 9 domain-containing protein [Verrucomicrobia bacterium]|nr:carbohydrate binding family 9 domain-containing protein [Verrucomicrobiota bacterium]